MLLNSLYALSSGLSMSISMGPSMMDWAKFLHLSRNSTCSAFLAWSSLLLFALLVFASLARVLRSCPISVSVKEIASFKLIWIFGDLL